MAKRHKKAAHSVAKEFPSQASPMDVVSHPARNLPDPSGGVAGMTNPMTQMGAPMGDSVY